MTTFAPTTTVVLPPALELVFAAFAFINIIGGGVMCGAALYYVYRSWRTGTGLIYLLPKVIIGVAGLYFCSVYALGFTSLPLAWISDNSAWLMRPVLTMLLVAVAAQIIIDAMHLDATEAVAEKIKAEAEARGVTRLPPRQTAASFEGGGDAD